MAALTVSVWCTAHHSKVPQFFSVLWSITQLYMLHFSMVRAHLCPQRATVLLCVQTLLVPALPSQNVASCPCLQINCVPYAILEVVGILGRVRWPPSHRIMARKSFEGRSWIFYILIPEEELTNLEFFVLHAESLQISKEMVLNYTSVWKLKQLGVTGHSKNKWI